MKKVLIIIAAAAACGACLGQWKPAGDQIKTKWAEGIDVNSVLPEYPRPQMERKQWQNLNGLWDYAITPKDAAPAKFDGKILVPFPVESALSGVGRVLDYRHSLWYAREFSIPQEWRGKNVILNFGAVDWLCEVFVNNMKIGSHTGGYTPFSFDITAALKDGKNTISVRVWDPTDEPKIAIQPRGKQKMKPVSCFYTAVSGIWQTVWLEPVDKIHIRRVKTTPNLDASKFDVEVCACKSTTFEVDILDGGKVVATAKAQSGQTAEAFVENAKLWSPDSPFLYDMKIRLLKDGKVVDEVSSYAAMRQIGKKILMGKDAKREKQVMTLNGKPIYNFGPLDQGWWPDGLYTAPTDEALKFDVVKTKQWGFNMIRKHIKVEPARWYYHCDKLGVLVWQDMPCGSDMSLQIKWTPGQYIASEPVGMSDAAYANYRKELKEMVDALWSYPCVVVWVPYNEAWGQHNTAETVAWLKSYDKTRLVNAASGGNYVLCENDILDVHSYPHPRMLMLECGKVNAIGEYGGLGYVEEGHTWAKRKTWGYQSFKNKDELLAKYCEFIDMLAEMTKDGVSAAVYTQTTDVENETNGIMTYDRKVVKFDEEKLAKANKKLIDSVNALK